MKAIDARLLDNGDHWIQWASTSKATGKTVKATSYYENWPFDKEPDAVVGDTLDGFTCVKVKLPEGVLPQYYETEDGEMVVDDTIRRILPESLNLSPDFTYTWQHILEGGIVIDGVEQLLTNSTPEQAAFAEEFGAETSAMEARAQLREEQPSFAG